MGKILFTGIYKPLFSESKGSLDDQYYGYLMPVRALNKIYMIDTYHIESPHFYSDRANTQYECVIIRAEEEHDKQHKYIPYISDYYYKHYYEVTEEDIDEKFKLVCDLKDYEPISDRELYKYNKEDYLEGVKLWWECKYPYGYNLIKKDAKENITLKINNRVNYLIYNFNRPRSLYEGDIKELATWTRLTKDYDKDKYNYLMEMNTLLKDLCDTFEAREKELIEKYNI